MSECKKVKFNSPIKARKELDKCISKGRDERSYYYHDTCEAYHLTKQTMKLRDCYNYEKSSTYRCFVNLMFDVTEIGFRLNLNV